MGFGLLAVVGTMVLMAIQSAVEDVPEPGEDVIRDDDTIAGSRGDDVIDGSNAAEVILPHYGNDVVRAGGGNDTISDHPWDREVQQGKGGWINPDFGNDTLSGGAGDDRIFATGGANVVSGDGGDDSISTVDLHPGTPFAPDDASGGAGDDWLVGDDGDTLTGGAGVDFFTNIHDAEDDAPVVITDIEPDETVEILIYDPTLLDADGAVPSPEWRDEDRGAVLTLAGRDTVVFSHALARDLAGNVRVLVARSA
ncbi:calcium-binding protein [Sagittula sp. SSi028]|uniref:calcium-binding protein n=1 Tax=Sagittula sp. SSi028 TaxID=3400636 RepID=UPI003AF4DB69